ncbi:MAG TPA: hypothetical protein VGM25_16135 [Caulobacteraceae bacterium]
MRRQLVLTLAMSGLLALPAAAAVPMLTVDGMAGVRIGMTVEEAEKVTGPLTVTYPNDDGGCGEAVPANGWIPGASLMVEGRRIVRIDIAQGPPTGPEVMGSTDTGIGIHDSIAGAKRVYGKRLRIQPDPYGNAERRRLVVKGHKPGREIIFETFRGRVTSFRAGLSRQVEYIEGCS